MRKAKVFPTLGLALCVCLALPAQTGAPSGAALERKYGARLAAFDAMVAKQMASDHTPGLAIAVLDGDEVWARAFGLSDVEDGSPMRTDSSFRLASVTKPMTATAVLQLAEAGKIDLDAEIQTYVPYFPKKPFPVTVRQLLGHTAGISHYKNREAELHIKERLSTKKAIAIFQDFDLVSEPGTEYHYSSYGYNLLGAAIEGASGQKYGAYMREHVWAPAGMADTRMDDPGAVIPHRVRGYEWDDGLRNSEFVDVSSRFAAGGTRSTVLDLLAFARAFMDGKLLSKAGMDRMTQPGTLRDGSPTGYGLGWGTDGQNGRFMVSHSGAQNETNTLLYILPGRRTAIAAAQNYESGNIFWYLQAFVSEVLGERWDGSGGFAAYLPSRVDRGRFRAVRATFQAGLADYERRGAALTEDPKKLRDAFAYFGRCVDRGFVEKDPAAALKACADGRPPAAGRPLAAVGSFMAKTSSCGTGPAELDAFHAAGPTAFFAAYIAAYRKAPSFPRDLRFDPGFEKQIARWNADWQKTFTAETRSPAATAAWGLDAGRLRGTFAKASIYPDCAAELEDTLGERAAQGNRDGALEAARLSRELYPDAARPAVLLAAAELALGDPTRARALVLQARSLDEGEKATGAANLNNLAYSLAGLGKLDAATQLLRIGIELHPGEANLWDSLGELEAKAGHTDAAIDAYHRALELDPKLESSRKALEKLGKTP